MRNDVHLGHKARKRFGQNFLNDPYIIDGIVSGINPLPGQNLVEIGPGLGAITEPVGKLVDKFTVLLFMFMWQGIVVASERNDNILLSSGRVAAQPNRHFSHARQPSAQDSCSSIVSTAW